jgi:hypothetical protein
MAQNNYIDFLRHNTVARDLNKQQTVLDPSLYTSLKSYSLVKSIQNTKITPCELMTQNRTRVFDMDISLNNCVNIQECVNTDQRVNRVLQPVSIPRATFRMNKVFTQNCCTFINGKVTRRCICSKKVCKSGTEYCGSIN